jgi:hypothetical protein
MKFDDPPVIGKKNAPMMPIAWVRLVDRNTGPDGPDFPPTRVFTTTMGSADDLVAAGTRRMLVNASFWGLGMENRITATLNVDVVGDYQPSKFAFNGAKKRVRPGQLVIK